LKEIYWEAFFDLWRKTMKKRNPKREEIPQAPVTPALKTPRRKVKPAQQKRYVQVDYPMEGEMIASQTYSFRISASPTERVEISIDNQEWLPCRLSVGYWWHEWCHFSAGPHSLRARIPSAGNRDLKSKPRQFTVLD
jgi:hypothetical protein